MEFDTRTGCPALDSSGDIIVRPDGNPVLFDSDGNKIVTSPSSGSSGDVVDGEEEIDRLIDSVSEVDGDRTASAGDEEEEGTGTMEHVIDNTDEDDVATPAVIEEVHVEGNIRLPKLKTHHDSVASNSNTAHKYNLIPKHKAAVVVEDEPVSHTYTLKPKHKAVSAHATRPTFKKVNGHWVKVKPAPEPVDGSHPDLFSHVN